MYFELPGTNIRLIGSLHRFPQSQPSVPQWINDAYEWSEHLIFEADKTGLLAYVAQPASSQLREQLATDTWKRLVDLWPEHLGALVSTKPWAVLLFAPLLTFVTADGVEDALIKLAVNDGKHVDYLETLAAFSAGCELVPIAEVVRGIEAIFADFSLPRRNLEAMHAAWLKQDLLGVYEIAIQHGMLRNPAMRDAILRVRNKAWATKLAAQLSTPKRTLIVVGSLDLAGPDSLFAFLEHEGRPIN